MDSVRRTEWSLSARPSRGARRILPAVVGVATFVFALCLPSSTAAQAPSASERATLSGLNAARGGSASQLDAILRTVDEAASKGLPTDSLLNKVREGFAKGVTPSRIPAVIREMAGHLETADRILRDVSSGAESAARRSAVTLLAEALGSGVNADEAREINRQARQAGRPLAPEILAGAAKALAFIKDARLPGPDGTRVVAEAARNGFRPADLLDLGREIKQRERAYQQDLTALRALGDAIARGERPERLFPGGGIERPERPGAVRPEVPVERPVRPEPPVRPERPERPETPERPPR